MYGRDDRLVLNRGGEPLTVGDVRVFLAGQPDYAPLMVDVTDGMCRDDDDDLDPDDQDKPLRMVVTVREGPDVDGYRHRAVAFELGLDRFPRE